MTSPAYAQVVFNLPLADAFTYRIPPALQGRVQVGMRVLAPFGPRKITGYVVALADTCDASIRLKDIEDAPDSLPVISQDLLDLTRWIADRYHAGWGEAIRAALPAGLDDEEHELFSLSPAGEAALQNKKVSPAGAAVLQLIQKRKQLSRKQIRHALKKNYKSHTLAMLKQEGLILTETRLRKSSVPYKTETIAALTGDAAKHADAETLLARSPKQKELHSLLKDGELTVTELSKRFPKHAGPLRELRKKGLVETRRVQVSRYGGEEIDLSTEGLDGPLQFTPDQEQVYGTLKDALDSETCHTFLLQGVTGSGKTEIYIRCIQQALDAGRTAIMMVPEISLTPQTVYLFRRRFGENVAILHSGLSAVERYLEWEKIRQGEVGIAIGARSAVFAPLNDLGIIIIDEEHDGSYKQDSTPRYHARETAIVRARKAGAVVLLGSATPSMESRCKAASGEYHHLTLPKRIGTRLMPTVHLVDMRKERDERKNYSIFSLELKKAILERMDLGEQVFLFLNRRGTANYVVCRKCGFVFECPHCSVSLTFHARTNLLLCHYCNLTRTMPDHCVECGGEVIRFSGFGTQKLEEETRSLFPAARTARLDRDTTRTRSAFEAMYRDMREGRIDILIGTQMITKGHDFPGVTLVGVVYADLSLHIPDFRSCERTFQLLTQVAGRAGRGTVPGRVVIQAHNPDHYVYDYVASHDYDGFYEKELALRQRLHYPPFSQLASLLVEHPSEKEGEAYTARLQAEFAPLVREAESVELLGPARAALYRLHDQFRWHFIFRTRDADVLQSVLKKVKRLDSVAKPPGTQCKVTLDVDPVNML
ncbi:primosomal protein N' [Nitrospina gracilis]|uniref:primosomal protein N' n=1 Tax=Nitrospina gracilis TaxID=35801 RepID=UPI001F00C2EA|nr:primosomal protein N' [Nitrospina gracilis]MCF8721485.1 primosomal protein N' (replication factor Y) [Nitrospina gracilis Nb-211]